LKSNIITGLAWIVGFAVFGGWMSIVGNPHVVETTIGLVMATGAGMWVYLSLNKGKGK
jgi:hypothetical protein